MISVGDAFAPVRTALDGAGIRYAIGGSWASTAFGEPRFTNDVDILADLTTENLDRFLGSQPGTLELTYPATQPEWLPFVPQSFRTYAA